jgi:hypothetical protein
MEGDTQSDPAAGATVAQRLIDQEDVDILIGSYASGISQAMLPVAERNDVIFWEVGAVAPTINADGYKNFLRTVGGAKTYAQADIDFINDFLAPQLGVDPSELKIAVGHEDGAFGASVADAILELAEAEGLNVVIRESWPANTTDLTPTILRDSQDYVSKKFNLPHNSLNFVFHGGSGSTDAEIKESVGYGVIKMNIDTDTQWATWDGILQYYKANEAYLQGQLGNPKGADQPNKKYYDPRVWLRAAQTSMITRLEQAFKDLNAVDVL